MITCGHCGKEFDSAAQPETSMGAVACPHCGKIVNGNTGEKCSMNKNWFKICNAVENADEAEVLIYDEIGGFGVTARDFIDSLKLSGMKKIHLRINSPGGEVFDGMTIFNYLRGFDVRVTVDGLAASMASVIAMAGKTVTMATGSLMMIHNPWGVAVGDGEDFRKQADFMDKVESSIVAAYLTKAKADEKQIREWMTAETWFTADEAVENGFADSLDESAKVKDFAMFNLSGFKHAPTVDTAKKVIMATPEAKTVEQLQTEVTAHLQSISAITGERDKLKADLTAAIDLGTQAEAKAVKLQASVDELTAKLAKSEQNAADKAATILAGIGVEPVAQSKETPNAGSPLEQYNALVTAGKHFEAAQFWAKNESAIAAAAKSKGK